jgi:DNA-binding response OmpR family regulator
MLEQLGFETITAANGKLALEVMDERGDEVDLVLLDMMMPVKSGAETMEELRRRWPMLPIIMSSGFDESDVTSRLSGLPATTFLQKPYRVGDLEGALRAVGAPTEANPVSAAG